MQIKVKLLKAQPLILAALGAKISQEMERSISELFVKVKANPQKSQRLANDIIFKHRHLILSDFLPFVISLENISRFAAIYIWRNVSALNLLFGGGIETSLRVAKAFKFSPILSSLKGIFLKSYERLIEKGIPLQDARYLLPEGVLTRMIFFAPPRYLLKLANSLMICPLFELKQIGKKIEKIVLKEFNLKNFKEMPPSHWEIFGKKFEFKKGIQLDYQKNIPSLSLTMGIRGSLAMLAQLVRQRQLLCEIEPVEKIAKNQTFVIPPSFDKEAKKIYEKVALKAVERQKKLLKKRDPDFVYFLLLGQEAKAMIFGKGFGIVETSKTRCCGAAQWEIRNLVGIPITEALAKYKKLKREIGPRCWREKRCLEPATFTRKYQVCKLFFKSTLRQNLKKLLSSLKESYQTFKIK